MHDDPISNFSANETFDEVALRLSRRRLLGGAAAVAGFAVLGGAEALVGSVPTAHAGGGRHRPLIGFASVPVSSADTITVPPGYTARVLIAWGDPVSDGPAFAQDASNSAADQEHQWGMHNDGLVYFPIKGSSRGLIVQNHEYSDDVHLFADGTANWTEEKLDKSLAAHGVSVIEVRKHRGRWQVVRPSGYARRVTGNTPMTVSGSAAGHPLLQTAADPTGTVVLGTLNNCAMGQTPWGTYLACEENFNGYFRKFNAAPNPLEARYGINNAGFGYNWHLNGSRFDVDLHPNEPNRFGWVVEIDPWNPDSTPVKRTALGRVKHEAAKCVEADDGRLVVYTGDDERFEYIYRFVSADRWRRMRRRGVSPLDEGTLSVAKFLDDGTGVWLPLTPDNPALAGWTQADILINTRGAADAAGGTKMDRPEWIDSYDDEKTILATCTNNSRRGTGTNPGADAANPRNANNLGHIIRWRSDDFTDDAFTWDHFALAGDPAAATPDGSTVVGDKYASPDGLYVAPSGRLWIQTDVGTETQNLGAYAGYGNNQMLCADPTTRETRRFLVGPVGCEVTGCMATSDERTLFVGIQHPGESPTFVSDPANPKRYSSWPDGDAGGRPRSSLLVITKDDGGEIGS